MVEGNAVIVCVTCRKSFDKGCPAIPGQADDTFKCEGCQDAVNAAGVKAALADQGGALELK